LRKATGPQSFRLLDTEGVFALINSASAVDHLAHGCLV
jgi:hypothetical protein